MRREFQLSSPPIPISGNKEIEESDVRRRSKSRGDKEIEESR
jgi:hypothetical protein